ncbi:amine dehydrogenase large subunit [Achromobacter seleniivolatilans]|uniref:Amine dehydrogenase large subunit n=1 Tax=Achromobacter seleniivolatilans TaxID=3047478 RepID=A0ABY9LVD0_9BURK|nr:amine dehydrogenase large subunit [Achromobacter sp. R39]WMD18318.1 amine dehydrogenase large subunit [Achromobacter sp. R39]
MRRPFYAACLALACSSVNAQDLPSGIPLAETHNVSTLTDNPRRLWVLDTSFPAPQAAKVWILDGNSGQVEGMFNMGYWPNLGLSPDKLEVYSVDSFWEKHTRGARHDYLTTRNIRTLEVTSEVELPKGRALIVTNKPNFDVTPDGRFGLSFNLAPATTVSVIDLNKKAYLGEIPIPGCGLIFASAPSKFTSVCSDGTLQTVTFDIRGEAISSTTERTEAPVFDAEQDPVFEHAGLDRRNSKIYLISYGGRVVPIDLSGSAPKPEPSWSLQGDAEKAAHWRPGGWQIASFNPVTQRLYVLMHQGNAWTHKDPATELWVVDVTTRKVEQRLRLQDKTLSVAISLDAEPLLYTIAESNDIVIYNTIGQVVARQEKLGLSPLVLYVSGEH